MPKNSILTKPQQFHEIFTQKFLTIFLVKSKSKTTTFSRVFHPKNRQFSREIKVEFLDKKWRFQTVVWIHISIIFHQHFYFWTFFDSINNLGNENILSKNDSDDSFLKDKSCLIRCHQKHPKCALGVSRIAQCLKITKIVPFEFSYQKWII